MAKAKVVLRKGRLTLEEMAYLDKNCDMDIDKLCKKLKRTKETVMGYLEVEEKVEPAPEPKRESYVKELFAKKEDRGVVVMTEAASMYMDERKKHHKNNLDQSFIHKFDKNK
jgi:hypothetical protein